jgi:hypothetical protein
MESKTVDFDTIIVAGNPISSITLNEPTAAHWLASFKQLVGVPLEEGRQKQIHFFIWKMSGLKDVKIIEELPFSVYHKLQVIVQDFLAPPEEAAAEEPAGKNG